MGFDQVYHTRYEFYPGEQLLSPIRKQFISPISVIATVAPVGMSYLAGQCCSLHNYCSVIMTILSPAICIALPSTVKLVIRKKFLFVPASFLYQTLLDVVKY